MPSVIATEQDGADRTALRGPRKWAAVRTRAGPMRWPDPYSVRLPRPTTVSAARDLSNGRISRSAGREQIRDVVTAQYGTAVARFGP